MKKILYLMASAVLMVAATGCQDLYELNNDPTKISGTIDPDLLIPTIQLSHSMGRQNAARVFTFPGAFVNHWTGSWGPVEYGGKGVTNNEYTSRLWLDMFYPEAVKNIVALESIVDADPALANYSAMVKVLRVETFLKLTDTYGDIPYTEAGQGYLQQIFNPKYDRQEDIYNDFFAKLSAAHAQLNPSLASPSSDQYYGGDVAKWKRLTASLMLRVAMRLVKVNPELAKAKAKEAYDLGVMSSNDDIAMVKHELSYETMGAGNAYADIMLQASTSVGFGPSQYRMTHDFFRSLCVLEEAPFATAPYWRAKGYDPRLLLIGRCYFSATSYSIGGGLQAVADAVDITELSRKFNAAHVASQSPANKALVDTYLNVDGYMTLPSHEFLYGGGLQRNGEYGYTGNDAVRGSMSTALISAASIDANLGLTAAEKTQFKNIIGAASLGHYYQRMAPAKWIYAVNAPWVHLSYAETQFLLAETSVRGWGIDSKPAADRFLDGYVAAVKQFSILGVDAKAATPSDAAILAYAESYLIPAVEGDTTAALEEISKQIWQLNYMDPFEAWSNIRRTNGMPTAYTTYYNRYPAENQTNGVRPNRLPYPTQEQSLNRGSWQAATDRLSGGDNFNSRVWWDVQ